MGLTVMVGSHDYIADVAPGIHAPPFEQNVGGIHNSGRPFWYYVDERANRLGRVFLGSDELSAGLGNVLDPSLGHVNRRGDAVWTGLITTNGVRHRDTFVGHEDLSMEVLDYGSSDSNLHPDVNDSGTVLWANSLSGKPCSLYVGRQLYYTSAPKEGLDPKHITNSGHVLWMSLNSSGAQVMRDPTDLSSSIVGPSGADESYVYMGESGDVAWQARNPVTTIDAVYRNQTDLSTALLGQRQTGDNVRLDGIDDAGNVLWNGGGANTGHSQHVFVNGVDLSADAIGAAPGWYCEGLTMGPNGHVLWDAVDPVTGYGDVYLSTPVPEPSVLLLGLPALVALIRRRRSL